MASDPLNMAGKICHICGKTLTAKSFTGSIPIREKGMVIHRRACFDCLNEHYSKGE